MPAASPSPPEVSPNALHRGTVHRLRPRDRWLFWPAAWGLNLYYRTLRVRIDPAERAALAALEGPRLLVLWHNRSLLFPLLVRDLDPAEIRTLVSASRAAAWQVAYYEQRGIESIRGSTTRGGSIALKECLRALRAGHALTIGPDGPSGPRYDFRPGVSLLARHTGASIVLFGANCPTAYRLPSWDRHLIPTPGQTVELRTRIFPSWKSLGARHDGEATAILRAALLALNDA